MTYYDLRISMRFPGPKLRTIYGYTFHFSVVQMDPQGSSVKFRWFLGPRFYDAKSNHPFKFNRI